MPKLVRQPLRDSARHLCARREGAVRGVRRGVDGAVEEPALFDEALAAQVRDMVADAVECEVQFAEDLLGQGVPGLSLADMRVYLQHVADRRLAQLGLDPLYGSSNPFAFMQLQDVQELSNFFERRVSAYQVAVPGSVGFDEDF